jgi:hypothetical protein
VVVTVAGSTGGGVLANAADDITASDNTVPTSTLRDVLMVVLPRLIPRITRDAPIAN